MIHGGHETSEMFSLDVVRDLVREIDPDYWLTEIPPNRWDRAWAEFQAAGTVEEPRVRRFPEYMEGLFPLTRELDFEAIPTAGWTEPMSDFRAAYLDAYARDPARADRWAEYQTAAEASAEALAAGAADDPRWIHTDAYDEAYDIRMRAYAACSTRIWALAAGRRSTPRTGGTSSAPSTVTGARASASC